MVHEEPDFTFTFKKDLERGGFMVDSFNDPSEALSHFKSGIYDLALIDVKMPQMDGFDLYRKLRKMEVKYCFMTAYETYYQTLRKDYPTLDIGCFIRKPLEIKWLVRELRSELQSSTVSN